jgi:hypothetical protein
MAERHKPTPEQRKRAIASGVLLGIFAVVTYLVSMMKMLG